MLLRCIPRYQYPVITATRLLKYILMKFNANFILHISISGQIYLISLQVNSLHFTNKWSLWETICLLFCRIMPISGMDLIESWVNALVLLLPSIFPHPAAYTWVSNESLAICSRDSRYSWGILNRMHTLSKRLIISFRATCFSNMSRGSQLKIVSNPYKI